MLPTRPSRRRPVLLFFLAGCAVSLLSSLFFYAWFGRAAGAVFLQPGRLLSSVLGDSVAATLLLALLRPLRAAGPGPFWACGLGVLVALWPPLADLVSAAFDAAAFGLAPAPALWRLRDWFYALLNGPDDLVLLAGSLLLLVVAALLWPRPAAAVPPLRYQQPVAGRRSPVRKLLSFAGWLPRRPYAVAALAIGVPDVLLRGLAPACVALPAQLLLFWPLLALATRRARDRGHPESWIVYMVGLPGALGLLLQFAAALAARFGAPDPAALRLAMVLELLTVVPVIWAAADLLLLRGLPAAAPPLATRGPPAPLPWPAAPGITPFASLPSRITAAAAARFRRRIRRR